MSASTCHMYSNDGVDTHTTHLANSECSLVTPARSGGPISLAQSPSTSAHSTKPLIADIPRSYGSTGCSASYHLPLCTKAEADSAYCYSPTAQTASTMALDSSLSKGSMTDRLAVVDDCPRASKGIPSYYLPRGGHFLHLNQIFYRTIL